MIVLYEKLGDGWWHGEVDGHSGIFPSTYVQESWCNLPLASCDFHSMGFGIGTELLYKINGWRHQNKWHFENHKDIFAVLSKSRWHFETKIVINPEMFKLSVLICLKKSEIEHRGLKVTGFIKYCYCLLFLRCNQ